MILTPPDVRMLAVGAGLAVAGAVGGFVAHKGVLNADLNRQKVNVQLKADVASGKLSAAQILALPEKDQKLLRSPVMSDWKLNVGAAGGVFAAGAGLGALGGVFGYVYGGGGMAKAGYALLGASAIGLGAMVGSVIGGINQAVRHD